MPVITVEDLAILCRVVYLVSSHSLLIDETLELVRFGHLGLVISECRGDLVPIDDNTIVIDLTKAVSLFQIAEAYLIIKWNVIALAQATDTHVDVVDARIIMYKHDVVVEDEYVDNEHGELDEEGHKEADEARALGRFVVVVHLEKVTADVLVCHINDTNKEKVQACGYAIPSYKLAHFHREAVDILL